MKVSASSGISNSLLPSFVLAARFVFFLLFFLHRSVFSTSVVTNFKFYTTHPAQQLKGKMSLALKGKLDRKTHPAFPGFPRPVLNVLLLK